MSSRPFGRRMRAVGRFAREHAGSGSDVENACASLQSGARQDLTAIPATRSERQERDRPVVPRRAAVEELLHEALALSGLGVELLQRRMRNDRRQREDCIEDDASFHRTFRAGSRRQRCAIGICRPLPNAFVDTRIVGAA